MSENRDEFFVHEPVVVGDAQDDDFLSSEDVAVFLVELGAVDFFHHEDEIGPANLLIGEPDLGIAAEAC